jgi:hypothetical protein
MEAQVAQPDTAGRGTTAAILFAMNVKAMQMLVTSGKQDLQDGMQVHQDSIVADQHPTPDERTDAAQDDP